MKMYSTTNDTTKDVCEKTGFIFSVQFVETMKRGNNIYVRGTAGKRDEFLALKQSCNKHGYIYAGKVDLS